MSRTPKRGKRISTEYWSRRSALCGLRDPGRYTKTQTHRAERRDGKQQIQESIPPNTLAVGKTIRITIKGIMDEEWLVNLPH